MGLGVLVVIAATAVVFYPRTEAGEQSRVEQRVLLEPAGAPGPDAFSPPVASSPPNRSSLPSASPQAGQMGGAEVLGSHPGLYGGTLREAACDAEQLVSFLGANPAKAMAWAEVLGMAPADIGRYVGGLTPVVLTVDVRVTNHGFRGGKATARQSVLQAGTAVMVDAFGVPRVRCYCGNPLLPPRALGSAWDYVGEPWEGFASEAVAVVAGEEELGRFELVDLATGLDFVRPVGTAGEADMPAQLASIGNGLIAFDSDQHAPYRDWDIYVVDPDSGHLTNLTAYPAAHDLLPAWSPDGSRIAFVRELAGNQEIYVMNADGTGVMRLTRVPGSDTGPAWSPDGTRIAFTSDRDGDANIFVMSAEGGAATRLTDAPGYNASASWSPDGARIAFSSTRDGNLEIYVMHADGSRQTNLTQSAADDSQPAWSPDGTKIAFKSDRGPGADDVYVMNADGTDLVNLTNAPRFDGSPAWSPDGTEIVFESGRDHPNNEIYVMSADGSDVRRLTRNTTQDSFPDWQPLPDHPSSPAAEPAGEAPPVPEASPAAGSLDEERICAGPVTASDEGDLRRSVDLDGDGSAELLLIEFREVAAEPEATFAVRASGEVTQRTLRILGKIPLTPGPYGLAWTGDLTGDGRSEAVLCVAEWGANDLLLTAVFFSPGTDGWSVVLVQRSVPNGTITRVGSALQLSEYVNWFVGRCSVQTTRRLEWDGTRFALVDRHVERDFEPGADCGSFGS